MTSHEELEAEIASRLEKEQAALKAAAQKAKEAVERQADREVGK
jgi:hypothetical protein